MAFMYFIGVSNLFNNNKRTVGIEKENKRKPQKMKLLGVVHYNFNFPKVLKYI